MGRAEKYADVIDKYEKGIKQLEEIEKKDKDLEEEKEEKLSVTREIKYEELQKEIDNSVTIADYEEMTDMEEAPKKKEITDTSEIQVEDVPEEIKEETEELEEVVEEVKEEKKPEKKTPRKVKKEDTAEVKIIDEPTEELLALDGEESDKDEDDLYLTQSMTPIKKKFRLRGFVKFLIVLFILVILGLFVFFKFIRPLYSNLVNADPQKVFENSMDEYSKNVSESVNEYAYDGAIGININTRIDANIYNFASGNDTVYSVSYLYNPSKKQMVSDIAVAAGEKYEDIFVLDNKMVYEKLSTYDKFIKLEDFASVMKDNTYYKEHKDNFNKLQKYLLPGDYAYYIKTTMGIIKDNFNNEMFSKKNDKIERKEEKINVIRNTLTLTDEKIKAINNTIKEKTKTDATFKRAYDVYGSLLDNSKKKLIINIYTKLNNKVVGFDIEDEGFTSTYYYQISDKSYDAHFTIDNRKYDLSRRDKTLTGAINGNEETFTINYKEETDNKLVFEFEVTKNGNKYTGELNLDIDKASRKYVFDLKVKNGNKYFNAIGSLDYKVNKDLANVDLTDFIDPPIREYNNRLEEFKNSFSSDSLYQKYKSWYDLVTNPHVFTFK